MFITKKHISRRTVLRGMGTAVALPFLESMVGAQTATRNSGPVQKHISDRTKISANGSKLLVVTRLPRAPLNSLLAIDAK